MKPRKDKPIGLEPRKEKPQEPVISRSECWAGLRLVEEMMDRICCQGNVPQQVVEKAGEFAYYIQKLLEEHPARRNASDNAAWADMYSAIEEGTLPTFRILEKDCERCEGRGRVPDPQGSIIGKKRGRTDSRRLQVKWHESPPRRRAGIFITKSA